jgi:hypothetical protein
METRNNKKQKLSNNLFNRINFINNNKMEIDNDICDRKRKASIC